MGTTTSLYFRRGHKLDLKKTEEKQIEYGFRKDQMRDLVQIMKVLQLTWAEVDRFHSAFNVLDIDRDGTVDRIEFTEAVGIEANDFSRECFHIITPKSRMNFIEFIAAITKICIANFDHLCRFAFRIVDVDCDGTLDPEEIQKVVNTIYGAEVTLKDPASRGSRHMESKTHSLTFMEVLRVADTDVDGKLSVGEFVKHARRFPQIVKPAHNLQLQLRRRIIGPYFWERRSKALSKRYDLLAAGMFETDWQEAGLGDWWGAYEQKWRHKKLDERDSLDTDFSFGDEKAHAGSSTLFPRVSSSSSSSSVGSSSFGSGKEKRKGGRSSVSNGARRGSSRVGPSAASTQHGPPQILRTSLLGVQGNDAQQPGATSYAQQQACTFPPASVEAVFNNDAAAAPRIPSGGDSQTSAAATAIVKTSLDPYSGSLSRNDDDDLVILTV